MRNSGAVIKAVLSWVLWLSIIIAISASDPYPLQDFCVADLRKGNVTDKGIECDDPYGAGTPEFMATGQGNSTSNYGFNATAGNVEVM
ncbi:hypothetical protein SUGI_0366770 [Cryptomeria japonica]|nr:hypothetical protein SUGI_0366770 [Cryptomeria japonica]